MFAISTSSLQTENEIRLEKVTFSLVSLIKQKSQRWKRSYVIILLNKKAVLTLAVTVIFTCHMTSGNHVSLPFRNNLVIKTLSSCLSNKITIKSAL